MQLLCSEDVGKLLVFQVLLLFQSFCFMLEVANGIF